MMRSAFENLIKMKVLMEWSLKLIMNIENFPYCKKQRSYWDIEISLFELKTSHIA